MNWHLTSASSRSLTLALLFGVSLLAGCVGTDDAPPAETQAGTDPAALAVITYDSVGRSASQGFNVTATLSSDVEFMGPFTDFPTGCHEAECHRYAFTLTWPDGVERAAYQLQLGAGAAPGDTQNGAADVWLEDASGQRVGSRGAGFYGGFAAVDAPAAGEYTAVAMASFGHIEYTMEVRLVPDAARPETGDLLPNLVTIAPRDLKIDLSEWGNLMTFPMSDYDDATDLAGVHGCAWDEVVEGDARRCLRISNGIGNIGLGALQVHLAMDEAAGALQGTGQFMQFIEQAEGGFRQTPVGDAYWHPTHAHLHYQGLASYRVHEYDQETGAIGNEVGIGRKAGFCLVDEGLVHLTGNVTQPASRYGEGCLSPERREEWYMGVTPGWFDMYETYRSDQYVEMTGVPDGVYVLVSITNEDGSILESDYTDNSAYAVFELAGDSVTILQSWSDGAPESWPVG